MDVKRYTRNARVALAIVATVAWLGFAIVSTGCSSGPQLRPFNYQAAHTETRCQYSKLRSPAFCRVLAVYR